jgi:hypothetical protein
MELLILDEAFDLVPSKCVRFGFTLVLLPSQIFLTRCT